MKNIESCLETVISALRFIKGVETLKILTTSEKKHVEDLEEKSDSRIAYGMCKTFNQGVYEALKRDFTLAYVIDTSTFEFPHHPTPIMEYDDNVVGEFVDDTDRIEELKKDSSNFFLWDNFVIHTPILPKDLEARKRLRLVYPPIATPQLEGVSCIENVTAGALSTISDAYIKKILSVTASEPSLGTCLIGFNML